MKILMVSNGYPVKETGGTELYTQAISRHLAKQHQVRVFTRENTPLLPDGKIFNYEDKGVAVVSLVNNNVFPPSFEGSYRNSLIDTLFIKCLEEFTPDVVHVQHCLGLSGDIFQILQERKIPYVCTLHDFWYLCPCIRLYHPDGSRCTGICLRCFREFSGQNRPLYPRIPGKIKRYVPEGLRKGSFTSDSYLMEAKEQLLKRKTFFHSALSQAQMIICPSQYTQDEYELNYSHKLCNSVILPHPMERKHLVGLPKPNFPPKIFGFMGVLGPYKGVHVLIEAFNKLESRAVKLEIWGDYQINLEYFSALKRKVKSTSNVDFMGAYKPEDLREILGHLDVVVIPSICGETFNFTSREALLAGRPLIASDLGVLSEVVESGQNGYLFEAGNAVELKEIIHSLINGELRPTGPFVGKALALDEYGDQLQIIYQQALGGVDSA